MQMSAPKDRGGLVYWIFWWLGVGILFPWNAFITAYDYFSWVYGADKPFMFWFSMGYNIPSFITSMVLMRWGMAIPARLRILGSYGVFLVLVAAMPPLGTMLYHNQLSHGAVSAIVLIGVVITGSITGFLFGSVTGLAAQFPGVYSQATMGGVGAGGVIVGMLRIVTKASLPSTTLGTLESSYYYFSLGAVAIFLCLVAFVVLNRLPFGRFHLQTDTAVHGGGGDVAKLDPKLADPLLTDGMHETGSGAGGAGAIDRLVIARKMFRIGAPLALTFFITLAIFPGVPTLIPSTNAHFNSTGWFAVILLTLFLVFDFIGRSLPRWVVLFNANNLWMVAVARLVFFPLWIFCVSPRLFHHDAFAYVIMILFATSNGYICSLAFMFAPSCVDEHERESSGVILTVALNVGIACGVGSSFALSAILPVAGSVAA